MVSGVVAGRARQDDHGTRTCSEGHAGDGDPLVEQVFRRAGGDPAWRSGAEGAKEFAVDKSSGMDLRGPHDGLRVGSFME